MSVCLPAVLLTWAIAVSGRVNSSTGCPAICTCNSSQTINCSNQDITAIPLDLPHDVQKLYLQRNSFKVIQSSSFVPYTKLKILNLQSNRIRVIEPNAFRNLYELHTLNLAENQLEAIHSDYFLNLIKLQYLDLTNNQIKSISSTAFNLIPEVKNIDLHGNPLICTCGEKYLLDSQDISILRGATCINYSNHSLSVAVNTYISNCPKKEKLTCPLFTRKETIPERIMTEICTQNGMACQVQLEFESGKPIISSRCNTIPACTTKLLPGNTKLCPESGDGTCNLCCTAPNCVSNRLLTGFSREVTYNVTYSLNGHWDDEYIDPNTQEFKTIAGTLQKETENALVNLDRDRCKMKIHAFRPKETYIISKGRLVCKLAVGMLETKQRDRILVLLEAGQFSKDIVNIQVRGESICPAKTYEDKKVPIPLPTTLVGETITVMCPFNRDENARFRCIQGSNPEWVDEDTSRCTSRNTTLKNLMDKPVTKDSVASIAGALANLTENTNDFKPEEVTRVAAIIENIIRAEDVKFNTTVGEDLLECINSMLDVKLKTLIKSEMDAVSRMISAVELMGNQLLVSGDAPVILAKKRVAMAVTPAAGKDSLLFETTGDIESDFSKQKVKLNLRPEEGSDSTSQELVASIYLPPSVVAKGNQDENITFVIFNSDQFFKAAINTTNLSQPGRPLPTELTKGSQMELNSRVVAASVGRQHLTDLTDPVIIKFKHLSTNTSTRTTMRRCVFWNVTLGHWSDTGCTVTSQEADSTICQCNHLTNFALLMDVFGNAGNISRHHKDALSYISYIGCTVSMVGLVLTLITYFTFRKLLKGKPSKILVNLCIALLGILVGFVLSTQIRGNNIACKIFAGITHYFLLAAMLWMLIEAFYMYRALVRVFHTYYSRFLLKCCLIGWGLPLVAVVITISISTDNYGLQDEICWLSRTPFLVALMVPVAIILLLNFITFGLVLRQLIQMGNNRIEKTKSADITLRLRGAITIMVLLGLTWIFAFLAIGGASIVFQYLFTIFNSLQGLFIFIFHCLLKNDAKNYWIRCLGCEQVIAGLQSSTKGSSNQSQTVSSQLVGGRLKDPESTM